jgi:hypothetical protein
VYFVVFITISQSAVEGFLSYHYLVGGWGDVAVYDPKQAFRAFDVMADLQPILVAPRELIFNCHDMNRIRPLRQLLSSFSSSSHGEFGPFAWRFAGGS